MITHTTKLISDNKDKDESSGLRTRTTVIEITITGNHTDAFVKDLLEGKAAMVIASRAATDMKGADWGRSPLYEAYRHYQRGYNGFGLMVPTGAMPESKFKKLFNGTWDSPDHSGVVSFLSTADSKGEFFGAQAVAIDRNWPDDKKYGPDYKRGPYPFPLVCIIDPYGHMECERVPQELLAAVSNLEGQPLYEALRKLIKAQITERRGQAAEAAEKLPVKKFDIEKMLNRGYEPPVKIDTHFEGEELAFHYVTLTDAEGKIDHEYIRPETYQNYAHLLPMSHRLEVFQELFRVVRAERAAAKEGGRASTY